MDNHVTKEQLWEEFYGNFGRDFGNPERWFTDNPSEIHQFIQDCTKNKLPAFISVQPKKDKNTIYGLEKLFFDFDYSTKSDALTEDEASKRKAEMISEVKFFLKHLEELNIKPLVIKTNKGYHVHVFLDSIYQIGKGQTGLFKQIYNQLQLLLLQGHNYKYVDWHVIGDINRLCRIPLSVHQKSGEECTILNNKLEQDKIRSIEYFRLYGLKEADIKYAINTLIKTKKPIHDKPINQVRSQGVGNFKDIRPCFKKAMDAGEMCHNQRLALLPEIFSIRIQDFDGMVDFFRCFNDFSENETGKQVRWFLENQIPQGYTKPYKCKTIQSKGWCIGKECSRMRDGAENKKVDNITSADLET